MVIGFSEARLALADFLNIVLIHKWIIFINYYTFTHVAAGFVGMFLIFKWFKKIKFESKFLILFAGVILWEVFELLVIATGSTFFREDPIIDTTWDIIFGLLGGYLYWYFWKRKK